MNEAKTSHDYNQVTNATSFTPLFLLLTFVLEMMEKEKITHGNQVTADQCHRGYTLASDSSNGLMSLNPLYIRSI